MDTLIDFYNKLKDIFGPNYDVNDEDNFPFASLFPASETS